MKLFVYHKKLFLVACTVPFCVMCYIMFYKTEQIIKSDILLICIHTFSTFLSIRNHEPNEKNI